MAWGNDTWQGNPVDNPGTGFFGGGSPGYGRGGGQGGGNRQVAFNPGQGPNGAAQPGGPIQTAGGGGLTPPGVSEGSSNPTGQGGGQQGGQNPANFGQGMLPWLTPYGGQFTAPMSPYEQGALGGYNQFVQGGQGLNVAGNYLNDVLGGQYLNLNSNPYLQQIQQGEQGMKNYNDQQAMNRIGSSMALGGNAMSGARLGAQNDYMNQSNNQFESMMGQLMNQNYGLERGMQGAAPGQLANLANQTSQGYGQLFGMGALPRQLQQNDYNSQYNDFVRQTGGMQNAYQTPDNQILQMLYGGGYHGTYQPQYGSSQLDQIMGLLGGNGGLGNIDWGGLASSLFGNGGGGAGTDSATQNQDGGVQFDGVPIGYDSQTPVGGPANYYDRNWYLSALDSAERNSQNKADAAQKGPNTTGPAIATLLLSLLQNKGGSNKAKAGAGASPSSGGSKGGGNLIDQIKSLFSKNPYPVGSAANQQWAQNFTASGVPRVPGSESPLYSGNGMDNMPGSIGYTPDNPLSGGGTGSFADIFNSMPPLDDGGGYSFSNADNGPNIGNFDPGFDFSGAGGDDFGGGDWGGGGDFSGSDVQF